MCISCRYNETKSFQKFGFFTLFLLQMISRAVTCMGVLIGTETKKGIQNITDTYKTKEI